MNATRPEADSEYSRGEQGPSAHLEAPDPAAVDGLDRDSKSVRRAVVAGGVVGCALILAAQFTPLFSVHTSASRVAIKTVQTGSHDSYALVPVAILGLLLTFEVWRTRSRLALAAIAVIAIVSLLIALLGDLPDAQATGLVGSTATGLRVASSSPSIGLYLETLGAVVLLITAAAGLLLLEPPEGRAPVSGARSPQARGADAPAPRDA